MLSKIYLNNGDIRIYSDDKLETINILKEAKTAKRKVSICGFKLPLQNKTIMGYCITIIK